MELWAIVLAVYACGAAGIALGLVVMSICDPDDRFTWGHMIAAAVLWPIVVPWFILDTLFDTPIRRRHL